MRPTPETDAERRDPTEIIIKSLRILARDIQSDDGVTNLALLEAADCLERVARERDEALSDLEFRRGLYKVLDEANNRLWTANEEAVALARTLKQERDEAREALEDWENAAAHVEADHPDEVHCGCVPVLRKLLTDARKERDDARKESEYYRERYEQLKAEREGAK